MADVTVEAEVDELFRSLRKFERLDVLINNAGAARMLPLALTPIAVQAIPVWAEPHDVANVIDFFLRPESRLITGQVIYLGGIG